MFIYPIGLITNNSVILKISDVEPVTSNPGTVQVLQGGTLQLYSNMNQIFGQGATGQWRSLLLTRATITRYGGLVTALNNPGNVTIGFISQLSGSELPGQQATITVQVI